MLRKGVSPLIATVLLIAFTLSIAGLLGGWLTSMTKTQTENIDQSSREVINCTNTHFDIFQVMCKNSTPSEQNTIRIAITNMGVNSLYDFSTYVQIGGELYINNTGGPNSTNPLLPGEQTILVYGCDQTKICPDNAVITRVRVSSSLCPSMWSEKTLSVTCT